MPAKGVIKKPAMAKAAAKGVIKKPACIGKGKGKGKSEPTSIGKGKGKSEARRRNKRTMMRTVASGLPLYSGSTWAPGVYKLVMAAEENQALAVDHTDTRLAIGDVQVAQDMYIFIEAVPCDAHLRRAPMMVGQKLSFPHVTLAKLETYEHWFRHSANNHCIWCGPNGEEVDVTALTEEFTQRLRSEGIAYQTHSVQMFVEDQPKKRRYEFLRGRAVDILRKLQTDLRQRLAVLDTNVSWWAQGQANLHIFYSLRRVFFRTSMFRPDEAFRTEWHVENRAFQEFLAFFAQSGIAPLQGYCIYSKDWHEDNWAFLVFFAQSAIAPLLADCTAFTVTSSGIHKKAKIHSAAWCIIKTHRQIHSPFKCTHTHTHTRMHV